MKNSSIFIHLPKNCDSYQYRATLKSKLKEVNLHLSFSLSKKTDIKINLNESHSAADIDLGYRRDESENIFISDKPTLLFHFNKNLNALCLCPAESIIEKYVLGVHDSKHEQTNFKKASELNLFSEKFLLENLHTPTQGDQIVNNKSASKIISKINSLNVSKINLFGDLDYLIPYLTPKKHSEIFIFSKRDQIKHHLLTKRINKEYHFEINIKENESNLIKSLFFLALRNVFLEVDYVVPIDQNNLDLTKIDKQVSKLKYLAEIYYDLLNHGSLFSRYLFEDLAKGNLTKESFKYQKKIEETCILLKKIEPSFFGFEILNKFIFNSLETLPPVTSSDLSLLQKETFDEASLVIQAFFDLLLSLEQKFANKRVINEC